MSVLSFTSRTSIRRPEQSKYSQGDRTKNKKRVSEYEALFYVGAKGLEPLTSSV